MSSKSSTDPAADPAAEETVLVGRVRRPHGVRGAVVVESLTDNADRWAAGSELLATGGSGSLLGAGATLTVEHAQEHGGAMLVSFAGVAGREAAEDLRGVELSVRREDVPPAEDGIWYEFQLVGCRCRDAAAGDLGEVVDLVEDGGGLLLVVDDGLRRLPVPFVADFLVKVDVAAGWIDVDLPPGLIEACASGS
jgi:16S rRNA processing protein RimM